MIYVKKTNADEKDFIALLEKAKGTIFEGTIRQTGTHAFPDIVANKYFGVEVKMTTNDHWTSTGNSVLESSRIEDVERIYIMFGKLGGKMDVRYRLYQECLPEVSVTHSPRYRINMELRIGKSIFDKIGVDYDALRKDPNTIQKIKNYYRSRLKDGEELWWIDQDADDKAFSPIIKPFRNLSAKEKENFIVESMILFPEMFGNSNAKYERAAAYLIAEYNTVSANLRDNFTAGGQVYLKINGKKILVPQVVYAMYKRAKAIKEKIKEIDEQKLLYYWRSKKMERDRLEQWKKLLKKNKLGVIASKVFEVGLL